MTLRSLLKGKGKAKEEPPAGNPPPYTNDPPSYDGEDKEFPEQPPTQGEELPDYEAPTYHNTAEGSTRLQAATRMFPPAMNGYYKWTSTTFHLGPSAAEKLFAVSTKGAWLDSSPPISLHSGPSAKDPILGKARGLGKWSTMETTVTVPRGITSANPNNDTNTTVAMKYTSWKDAQYTFSIRVLPVPGSKEPRQFETFEWRTTYGTEAKEISGGSWSSGYKLVHMTAGPAGEGGARKAREVGITSDGREIVAIIVHNSSWSLSKGMRFAFMGTGLTGIFGEEWEITALVTGLQLWILAVLTAAVAA